MAIAWVLAGCGGNAGSGGDAAAGDAGAVADAGVDSRLDPPATVCTPPIELYDTSSPTAVIGTGTPASCTEQDLRAAAEAGGIITFDCGPDPVTIDITQTIVLPADTDTIIDGGGLVTLDAGLRTRHFLFNHPDWLNNQTKVVLQRLTFRNGQAPLGEYFPRDPANPNCAYGYKEGSGGVIFMRNGVLHVIDCAFYDNRAALEGPDVGGGAIYVTGVPELIVRGSRFVGNRAANAGAIGLLFANRPEIYNSVFENNTAEGVGANYVEPGCPVFNHAEQGGAGGNGGAVTFDGLNDAAQAYIVCGSVFRNNRANELAGALFRTPNAGVRDMRIEQSTFDGNTALIGGVSFIKQNNVTVRGSTFMNNRGGRDIAGNDVGGPLGGLWINEGTIDLQNCTFSDNQPSGLDVEGTGTVTNATFVNSRPNGNVTIDNSLFVDTSCDTPLAGANNVQWPAGPACAGGVTTSDPQLGSIGDNGGATPTFLPGSPSAVQGVGTVCPPIDQRGQTRDRSSCAAGAVEP